MVYGIPSTGNAQGIIYNKKVAEAAGYTSENLPKTPDEFLTFLQAIQDNTDAIPLYTNFAAGWTMTAWDAYIYGGATADPDWKNITMPQTKDPFADQGNGTGAYAVYKLLYDAVSMGLTEESPTATDWEGSKPMINNGEIGTMVLGSWAIIQMQEAGPNAADIGYMPFPITQPDGIGLVEDTPAPTELASLQADVNRESEMSLDADQTHVQRIVEAVITGSETFEDIIADGTPAGTAPWTATPPASNRLLAPAPSKDGAGAERESEREGNQ